MIKLLFRSKRSLSPVVTTIFLFGIIMGAIALSLGIIYPNLQQLEEQIAFETSASSLLSLDQDLKKLMLNGGEAKIYKTIDTGSGVLIGDSTSRTTLNLLGQDISGGFANLSSPFFIPQSQLIIEHTTQQNILSKYATIYLTGDGFQNLYYLNSTTKSIIPWAMITEVRYSTQRIYTILTYRNLISVTRDIDVPDINLTISIQSVLFNFIGGKSASSNPNILFHYRGLNLTTTFWTPTIWNNVTAGYDNIWLKTITDFSQSEALSVTDAPYSHEIIDYGTMHIRIQYITHIFDISM